MNFIYELLAWITFFAVVDNFTGIDLSITNNTQETLIFIIAVVILSVVLSLLK